MQEEGGHTQLTAPTQSNTFTLSVQTGKKENKTALKQALQHMKNIPTSCLSTLIVLASWGHSVHPKHTEKE